MQNQSIKPCFVFFFLTELHMVGKNPTPKLHYQSLSQNNWIQVSFGLRAFGHSWWLMCHTVNFYILFK